MFHKENPTMKRLKIIFGVAMIAFGAVASAPAVAGGYYHGGGVRYSVYVGPGFWYPPPYYGYAPYYYPPYYYPPVVAAPAAPTTYVEQSGAQSAPVQSAPAQPSGYWYYCEGAKAYYPYVKECSAGWQRVAPQPAQ
jgi:hypothetical protein